MKQSICYLYAYENYKQTKNVGFVKCILKKDKVIFQIHGKGLDCDKFMDLDMFLFTSKGNEYKADKAGNVEGSQGVINYMVTVDSMDMEKVYAYDGILLESVSRKQYVALWKQKEVYLEQRIVEDEYEDYDSIQNLVVDECDYEEEESQTVCACLGTLEEQEPCQCEETSGNEEVCGNEETGGNEEVCECDTDKKQSKFTYKKIDRHGIAGLPQREWKWANNNFLIHGFTNYKHLMLIREEEKLYLGIPGIYHRKEEAAAKSFGFPMFHPLDECAKQMIEIEWNTKEQFGYWCRPVTERKGVEQRYDRCEYAR